MSTTCSGVQGTDCFYVTETNVSALPLNCDLLDRNETLNLTCFRISFTPITAASTVGGFIKLVPQLLFSVSTLKFIKVLHKIKRKISGANANDQKKLFAHIITVIGFEVCVIGFGVFLLLIIIVDPKYRNVTYATANPLLHLTLNFTFLVYFMTAGFLWCIYPLNYKPSFKKTLTSEESSELLQELTTVV